MTRPVLAALLLLATVAPAPGQGEPEPLSPQQEAEAAHKDLTAELEEAVARWRTEAAQAVRAAQAAGKEIPMIAYRPPTRQFVERAEALAEQYAGTDAAVPFLGFVVQRASDESESVRKALRTLWADHSSGTAITGVLEHVGAAYYRHEAQKEVMNLLAAVVEDNEHGDAKAAALVARGKLLLEVAQDDAARAAAAADLRKVATVTQNAAILQQAKDALFEIEHLQIGCTAPDIAALDTEGVPMKLSDYRGKVVLLDFWGFW